MVGVGREDCVVGCCGPGAYENFMDEPAEDTVEGVEGTPCCC